MITCSPWNPVVTKNLLPNALSAIEKEDSIYSINWHKVNKNPRIIVKIILLLIEYSLIKLWWAQVTVIPLLSKIIVFRSGTWNGLRGWTPVGGHVPPSSNTGTVELWKKAQNQATKKNTSLKMNRAIPHFNPSWTSEEWSPLTPSRETSRHQRKQTTQKKNNL